MRKARWEEGRRGRAGLRSSYYCYALGTFLRAGYFLAAVPRPKNNSTPRYSQQQRRLRTCRRSRSLGTRLTRRLTFFSWPLPWPFTRISAWLRGVQWFCKTLELCDKKDTCITFHQVTFRIDSGQLAQKWSKLGLILLIIVGRWLLPRGELTRDQLSTLLLVYVANAADIMGEQSFYFNFVFILFFCPLLISTSVAQLWGYNQLLWDIMGSTVTSLIDVPDITNNMYICGF